MHGLVAPHRYRLFCWEACHELVSTTSEPENYLKKASSNLLRSVSESGKSTIKECITLWRFSCVSLSMRLNCLLNHASMSNPLFFLKLEFLTNENLTEEQSTSRYITNINDDVTFSFSWYLVHQEWFPLVRSVTGTLRDFQQEHLQNI